MKGSCLCRKITYTIDKLDMPIVHCHCETCRKSSGSPFTTVVRVAREAFQWLTGEDTLSSFESSPGKVRYFCSLCGSPLASDKQNLPYIIVRVGSLDGDPGQYPKHHIWTSHSVPWMNYMNIPAYKEWPVEN